MEKALTERFLKDRYGSYSNMRRKRGLPHVSFAQYRAWKLRAANRVEQDPPRPVRVSAIEIGARDAVRLALRDLPGDPENWDPPLSVLKAQVAAMEAEVQP